MTGTFADELDRWGPGAPAGTAADDASRVSLAEARRYCRQLATSHYENFPVVSWMLPRRLHQHFYNVYAFCRWADDLGDEVGDPEQSLQLLSWWRDELQACYANRSRHPVFIALKETIDEFDIPAEPFTDLISAFEQDQRVFEYETFGQLLDYCRRSANPVGRLVLFLCRSHTPQNVTWSDSICTGLQLANFWQDVCRDFEIGRIYLPREDRERFGYSHEQMESRETNAAFLELMRFEVDRAEEFLSAGLPLVSSMPGRLQVDIELFIRGGLRILDRIRRIEYRVWETRPVVGKLDVVGLLLSCVARRIGRIGRKPDFEESKSRKVEKSKSRSATPDSPLPTSHSPLFTPHSPLPTREPPLDASYEFCTVLTKRTARNFFYSFHGLPSEKFRAMCVLYAFMRVSDDLGDTADLPVEQRRRNLDDWRQAFQAALNGEPAPVGDSFGSHDDVRCSHDTDSEHLHSRVLPAVVDVIDRYQIPTEYFHAVIDGIAMDLEFSRFETFDELADYCYHVAGAVGLCCIHIWGFHDERAKSAAIECGLAFQLTNILRDLGTDSGMGRVYLPREDLERFDFSADDIARHCRDRRFEELMAFEVERAKSCYRKAEVLFDYLEPPGKPILRAMLRIYGGLLKEIERRNYDVFTRPVGLPTWRKLLIAADAVIRRKVQG